MAHIRYPSVVTDPLNFYVERAPDADNNTIFASSPEQLVVYVTYDDDDRNPTSISGYCKGATRGATGRGSIVGYHISGFPTSIIGNWRSQSDVSGIVVPVDRVDESVRTKSRKSNIQDMAFLTTGVPRQFINEDIAEKAQAVLGTGVQSIKIATTSNSMQVSSVGDLKLDFVPTLRSTGDNDRYDYSFDDGTIVFEDFIFYGNFVNN